MFIGFANPIFAWIGVIALLAFVLSLMWKAAKVAVFFVVLAVAGWIVFFTG